MLRSSLVALLLVGFAFSASPAPSHAQVFDRFRSAVEREVDRRLDQRIQQAARATVDAAEDAIVCAATDQECIDDARADDQELVIVDEDHEVIAHENAASSASDTEEAAALAPGEGVWANYDFVPGERVLFAEDFSRGIIGRFPQRLEFLGGMMELVEWEDRQMLRSTDTGSRFHVSLPETLPDRFTIEFDAYYDGTTSNNFIRVYTDPDWDARGRGSSSYFTLERNQAGLRGPIESTTRSMPYRDEITAVRIAVDGPYAAMYLNEERVANIPNANLARSNFVGFHLSNNQGGAFIDNLRIAAGGREMMYDRLMTDGRLATHGVLFETGSARIQPESTPTLQDIARMLNQHSDLRLRIEGHTDNVGNAEANQRLSEERAQAVLDHLVNREGIDLQRLEAVGMGEMNPAADNSTLEGRQTNRRVELVVID